MYPFCKRCWTKAFITKYELNHCLKKAINFLSSTSTFLCYNNNNKITIDCLNFLNQKILIISKTMQLHIHALWNVLFYIFFFENRMSFFFFFLSSDFCWIWMLPQPISYKAVSFVRAVSPVSQSEGPAVKSDEHEFPPWACCLRLSLSLP